MSLTRESLLALPNTSPNKVVLSTGAIVYVRPMSGLDRELFEAACSRLSEDSGTYCVRALLTIFCACDETGKRLFTEGDLAALSAKDSTLLSPIYTAASALNFLGDKTASAEKNSEIGTDAASPTA